MRSQQEPGNGAEGLFPRTSEGAWPYQHLDFRLPAFRTIKKLILLFKPLT